MIKTYYMLTKPGIIMGNIITTAAGFILASKGAINGALFLWVLLGIACIMASACVFNNYTDRHHDEKMERTKNRALVTGMISLPKALFFASILFLAGTAVLLEYTNLLTVGISLAGFFMYVVMYSIWKYRSTYGTLVGSVAGAVPPLMGYCAVSNQIDLGAVLLFVILVLWQMPHFYAIAMYRQDDYLAAAIPVFPIKKGSFTTKVHMISYVILFIATLFAFTAFGYTGYWYLLFAVITSLAWLGLSIKGFKASDDKLWARQMFRVSLVVIMVLSIMISVDTISA